NPYLIDELAVRLHRSAIGVAWRWRTELATSTAATAVFVAFSHVIGIIGTAIIVAAYVALIAVVPQTRRFTIRRCWCILARHRIQKLCFEARLHTRSGRLPLVLWTRPTKV